MTERASIFSEEETDLDVTGFAPKKPEAKQKSAPREAVRAVSEAAKFPSREVPPASPPAQAITPIREARRHRTGRNVQMNVKLKQETVDTFYEITDSQGWVLGETLEQALLALKEKLAS